jgi:apolipoprotein N-acyltransferase
MVSGMRSLAVRIVVLWGWRRLVLAFGAGLLSVAALPPYYFFPILFLTFPILVWLIDGIASMRGGWRNMLTAGLVGWCFGFGYFLGGLYWLGEAFLVDANLFAWMIPIVLTLLPAALAIFPALACLLAYMFWAPGFARILTLAASWAIFEWIRGHALTGFPWNAIGYAVAGSDALLQVLSVIGLFGLCFVVVIIVSAPAVQPGEFPGDETRSILWRWRGPGAGLLFLIFLWGGGQYRLSDSEISFVDNVRLRIMQPNIKQTEKWRPANRSRIFADYIELSNIATSPNSMGIENVTHLIWPESAPPFLLEENTNARASLAALLPKGTSLITGGLRRQKQQPGSSSTSLNVHNSVLVVDSSGAVASTHDKFHLVPFGEYLPFEKWLTRLGLRKLVTVPGGLTAGSGPELMEANGAPPFVPLVCYEAIFPRYAAFETRPGWILNVTNDAWFGSSNGPWQHFEQARARAVEQGLPLVRAANTGISSVVDPYGRVIKRLGINQRGVIDAKLPKALPKTIYARFGNLMFLIIVILSFMINASLRYFSPNTS